MASEELTIVNTPFLAVLYPAIYLNVSKTQRVQRGKTHAYKTREENSADTFFREAAINYASQNVLQNMYLQIQKVN